MSTGAITPWELPVPGEGTILLTGATGFVGQELLARILQQSERHVHALVRAGDRAEAQRRIDDVISQLADPDRLEGRVTAVPAELTAPGLGLDESTQAELTARVTTVIHCAASVSFSMPLAESRQINVEGTKRILELARRCQAAGDGLERMVYVSTAYVAGRHRGSFSGQDLQRGQRFRNPYEQSKHEAEVLVHDAGEEMPVQIFRPSIVVGDRRTGWTTSFNVLYQPMRAFSRGLYSVLPGRLDAPVDVISVDYVADAIWALSREPFSSPETHLLVSGSDATTVRELATLTSNYFDRPAPRIVSPLVFRLLAAPLLLRRRGNAARAMLEHSSVYFPYFEVETRFDDTVTRAALKPHGIAPSSLNEYLPHLLDFAVQARWGKSMPRRPLPAGDASPV